VTLQSKENDVADGNENILVHYTYASATFNNGEQSQLPSSNVVGLPLYISKVDDEEAGLRITTAGCIFPETSESGRSCKIQVTLTSRPTSSVGIVAQLANTSFAVLNHTSSYIVSPSQWDQPVGFVVQGLDQDETKSLTDQTYSISFRVDSDDPMYASLFYNISLTHGDNDYDDILLVRNVSGYVTDELGLSQSFTLQLKEQPENDIEKNSLKMILCCRSTVLIGQKQIPQLQVCISLAVTIFPLLFGQTFKTNVMKGRFLTVLGFASQLQTV